MSRLLNTINSPEDLRRLQPHALPELAAEVRQLIIDVLSEHPGHLASNLGVVELTIALHYCFDFLRDRLVWDVGHQTYTHKILTGRREQFGTLREKDGLSGFMDKRESPYDPFTFGHTGTSISTALGLVCGDELENRERRIVAVIGDGAMASGMPFEALNHAGALDRNVLLILNDNDMSISRSVGAVSHYLSKIRSSRPYTELRKDASQILSHVPLFGQSVGRLFDHVSEGIQTALTPGGLFVELGWHYFGPVDGHDIDELLGALRAMKGQDGPVLLHTVTRKGHGFPPAVQDPTAFHSSRPFQYRNGTLVPAAAKSTAPSFTKIFGQTLLQLGEEDRRINAITAAMPDGTGTRQFGERFPGRFFDVGICEQHAVGFASGLATAGRKPIVAVYSTFLQRANDQLFHEIALQELPVIFCLDRAGMVGNDGVSHNGSFDIAYLRYLPHFVLMAPRDGRELQMMLRWAVRADQPTAIRYPRDNVPAEDDAEQRPPIEPGRAELVREGENVLLWCYGVTTNLAMVAAEQLRKEHQISPTIVNARFAKPMDTETLGKLLESHDLLVTLEDHALAGGFGSAVLESMTDQGLSAPQVHRLGIPDRFINHAPRTDQLDEIGLSPNAIVRQVLDWTK